MLGRAHSIALLGMEGHPVDVEVSIGAGLPAFTIVGLPDPSIQEARERVRAAITAVREEWPLKRVTVNLSPAHLRKAGSSFDLAMALGVLAAAGRVDQARLVDVCVLGELSLDGAVRGVRGVLPATIAAADAGARILMVPAANAREAALVTSVTVLPIAHLRDAVRHLRGEGSIEPTSVGGAAREAVLDVGDLSDVRGNADAKRALEIAAAGGHNLLMIGAPGGGKTMLARRMPTILPPMTDQEAFEVTRLYSVAGLLGGDASLVRRRPVRAPHHTVSTTGLIGGGSGVPHPGEVSLAHRGVLFLDEFGEFRREQLESLRQPIEDGVITIVRSRWSVTYPARFQLIAATNPCPCGNEGDDQVPCSCSDARRAAYAERLSGPIMDRIDLQVTVPRVLKEQIFGPPDGAPSAVIAERTARARERQRDRCARVGVGMNSDIPARDIEQTCVLTEPARHLIEGAVDLLGLTARGAHRVARVARTIADLDASEQTERHHVEEALVYRVVSASK